MKKLYTLALAAAVAMSASAKRHVPADGTAVLTGKNYTESALTLKAGTPAKAPAKAASVNDYAGEYSWVSSSLLDGNAPEAMTLTVSDAATGAVTLAFQIAISETQVLDLNLDATLDPAAGTLSILNGQELFEDSDGPVFFYVKGVTNDGYLASGKADVEATVGTISGDKITFPTYDIWAFGDWEYEDYGWYILTYSNALFSDKAPENPNEGWENFSTGTFIDAWGIPGAGIDSTPYSWSVNIQRSTTDANLYRLDNPYRSSDFFEEEETAENGYIVFSLADPEFVTVKPYTFSGLLNGTTKIYAFNLEGFYEAMGYSNAEVIEGMKEKDPDFTASSYNDGVVTIENARFDISRACSSAYVWSDGANTSYEEFMHGKITFDTKPSGGVEGIIVDNSNTPVEYFNLQGVRVDNPENGLYIRRQGNNVQKVLVK